MRATRADVQQRTVGLRVRGHRWQLPDVYRLSCLTKSPKFRLNQASLQVTRSLTQ
jgi:hypothetical protein